MQTWLTVANAATNKYITCRVYSCVHATLQWIQVKGFTTSNKPDFIISEVERMHL